MPHTQKIRHPPAQLLKHALGLATQQRDRFALHYLYYDVSSSAGAAHAEEVARFGARVGEELAFKAVTYQDLYRKLAAAPLLDADYLDYLGSRYFPPATESVLPERGDRDTS